MTQYIRRWKRAWKLLEELNPDSKLSEGHHADLFPGLSGLDKNKRLMVKSSIGNACGNDKVAVALMKQHLRIHLGEKRSRASQKVTGRGGSSWSSAGKAGKGRGIAKGKSGKWKSSKSSPESN